MADLQRKYDVRNHPKYKSGEMTKQQVFTEFLKSFEPEGSNKDGTVSFTESGVSISFEGWGDEALKSAMLQWPKLSRRAL